MQLRSADFEKLCKGLIFKPLIIIFFLIFISTITSHVRACSVCIPVLVGMN